MNTSNITVYKANKLIEASYSAITLQEQLLLLACIASSDPRTLTADTQVYLTASAFADLADLNARGAYDDLQRAATRLFHRYVTIDNPDPEDPALAKTLTRWVSAIDYFPGQGRVRVYFSPRIIPYLAQLSEQFTKYKLRHVAKFRSLYGVRLYELLIQWQSTGEREIQIDWLRKTFGLQDKYPRIDDLKRRVINPAIKDVNEHSNLWVKCGQRKMGRRIVAFQFQFGLKESKEAQNAKVGIDGEKPRKLTRNEIARLARPGESWEQAEARLRTTRTKPPPTK
ncbi:MAG TPA: RepB family plasmid replication initiator protein [Desulfobacterales bacterium]|nr:RepB family plasmid replication initiator protein [Desulfobacterales bacterium]